MPRATTYESKCAMAINLGYSSITNAKQRELPWYGLWNAILTQHFALPSPFLVCPQYPVWHCDDVEGMVDDGEEESGDTSLTLKPGDDIPGGIAPAGQLSAAESITSNIYLHGEKHSVPD